MKGDGLCWGKVGGKQLVCSSGSEPLKYEPWPPFTTSPTLIPRAKQGAEGGGKDKVWNKWKGEISRAQRWWGDKDPLGMVQRLRF